MHTLEEAYRVDVRAINALYSKGSVVRERARRERREQLEADLFERDGGDPVPIRCAQGRFVSQYWDILVLFYGGEIDDQTYRRRRIGVFRAYAQRLFDLGLVTSVFDDNWVRDFARDGLQVERDLLPPKITGFTEADGWLLCNPLRQFSRRFFRAVHSEFGRARLRREPEVYPGIQPQNRPD